MKVTICDERRQLGREAASEGAYWIKEAIKNNGEANVVFVTGKSQVMTLFYLTLEDISWDKVNVFHLDEFVSIPKDSLASSYSFLNEYFLSKIGKVKSYTPIDSDEAKVEETIKALNDTMKEHPLDVAFICIGENGHLAFNDPPADFTTDEAYKVVVLDTKCRMQQVGEGWFETIDDVPEKAISMMPKEIMKAEHIVTVAPHSVKAKAIYDTITHSVSPDVPATLLKTHPDWNLFIDDDSAAMLFGK